MSEVKREKRYSCHVPLKYAVTETGIQFSGEADNASRHGLCFKSAQSAPAGQSIHIRMDWPLPDTKRSPFSGEVRWCQLLQKKSDAVYRIGIRLEN